MEPSSQPQDRDSFAAGSQPDASKKKRSIQDYQMIAHLGEGAFGTVTLAVDKKKQ